MAGGVVRRIKHHGYHCVNIGRGIGMFLAPLALKGPLVGSNLYPAKIMVS
jgi:hypothetical protein